MIGGLRFFCLHALHRSQECADVTVDGSASSVGRSQECDEPCKGEIHVAALLENDGLPTNEVGEWAKIKYALVGLYGEIFSKGMKDKWDRRIYIDLFAGSGRVRVRNTGEILNASPLIALGVTHPYDLYIFCERDTSNLSTLKQRVATLYPNANVVYVAGDCNEQVSAINAAINNCGSRGGGLSFCFADPFGIAPLKFATIEAISAGKAVDFLVLLALAMDANRFKSLYAKSSNTTVDEFLGNPKWRNEWSKVEQTMDFRPFLAEQYGVSMGRLKYIPVPLSKMKEVRSSERNLPLYHLAFFSRDKRGYAFWDQVLKYGTDQFELFG